MTLLVAQPLARGQDEPVCEDTCETRGLELTVTELVIPLDGLSLDEVDRAWRAATEKLWPAEPRLSDLQACGACGARDEIAREVSLRYELLVPLPAWVEPVTVTPADRAAIRRYVAALQGRANRLAADHRESLAAVVGKNRDLDEIRRDVEQACERALERDAALLEREGCVLPDGPEGVRLAPLSECQLTTRAPKPARCRVED